MTELEALHLHVDGACRGNPGEAGFGVHAATPTGEVVASLYGYIGHATNNIAEYRAVIQALSFAQERGVRAVCVFSDSELVVRQMLGRYRVKHPDLIPLHAEAVRLLKGFERASVSHVRREANRDADRLANRALDEKASQLS